ncbi:MAG: GFA family protein [Pseudomonadota bacterium]
MAIAEGGCLCGAARYAVQAEPTHVNICHCHFCQRATGAPYLVEPIFAKEAFSVSTGELARYSQTSEGIGKAVNTNFCADCGTELFLDFEGSQNAIGVYGVANVDKRRHR